MLTLIEKLCAKILAIRFRDPIGKVIDRQQIGFLKGRDIMDNLLTYMLAKEVVTKTKQEALQLASKSKFHEDI